MGRARRPGPRSLELLRWIERLDVVGLEPLGVAHRLSMRTTYSHVERLVAAGLVERLSERNGTLVAITGPGRREVRPELLDRRAPRRSLSSGILVNHALATSWLAARSTLRGFSWVSDREMRTMPEWRVPVLMLHRRGSHRPDLGVGEATRIAIEVELSAKAADRLRAIFWAYEHQIALRHLAGVIYVVDHPAVRRSVQRAARTVGLSKGQFRILELEDVYETTRRLAREPDRRTAAA